MKAVERNAAPPLVYWADQIEIRESKGVLYISGTKHVSPSSRARERDLLSGYFDAIANLNPKAGTGNTSPHIAFANCSEDGQLVPNVQEAAQPAKEHGKGQRSQGVMGEKLDSSLRKYVLHYGPVLAEPASVSVKGVAGGAGISARQRWDVLRREQRTLRAVLQVFEQIRSSTPSHNELFNAARAVISGTTYWVTAYRRHRKARVQEAWQERPSWIWTSHDQHRAQALANSIGPVDTRLRVKCPECETVHQIKLSQRGDRFLTCECGSQLDPIALDKEGKLTENPCPDWAIAKGRVLLCHILNGFSPKLTDYNGMPLEMPSEDVRDGILPVLYQLIRQDYLRDARITRCAWKECRKWFSMGSHGSPCCSPEHSERYRQAKYYRRKGKATRALRRKRQRASKKRERRRR